MSTGLLRRGMTATNSTSLIRHRPATTNSTSLIRLDVAGLLVAGAPAAARLIGTAAIAGHEPGLSGVRPTGHGPGRTTHMTTRHEAGLTGARRTGRGDIATLFATATATAGGR